MTKAGEDAGAPVQGKGKRIRSSLQTWWLWVAAGVLVLALALLFLFNPAHHGFYPQCVFYRVTGLSCPGCGGLRATHQLLRGDVVAAFRFNPFIVLALPVVGWLIARRWLRRPPLSHRAVAVWTWAAVVALLVFAVVRNLPPGLFAPPPG